MATVTHRYRFALFSVGRQGSFILGVQLGFCCRALLSSWRIERAEVAEAGFKVYALGLLFGLYKL